MTPEELIHNHVQKYLEQSKYRPRLKYTYKFSLSVYPLISNSTLFPNYVSFEYINRFKSSSKHRNQDIDCVFKTGLLILSGISEHVAHD